MSSEAQTLSGLESLTSEQESSLVFERVAQLLTEHPPESTNAKEFWGAQYDLGLAWVGFPIGQGGMGVSPRWQGDVNREIIAAGGSVANRDINLVAIGMAAPTLVGHAPVELQRKLLRPIFTTDEIWCQLFSEPGAGSDLAGLSTSAVRDGDHWLVNGQKVWTTLAHRASWGLLLARTDPRAPKHSGLTYFIVDMSTPGIEVRPLFEMTGEAEFNEVFFDDAVVPDSMRLGAVGGGWTVTITTLMTERVMASGSVGSRSSGAIASAIEHWESQGRPIAKQDELVKLWVAAESLRLTQLRANESASRGTPGPEGSVAKLLWAELNKQITSFALNLLGPEGMLYPNGYEFIRPELSQVRTDDFHKSFLRTRANSIEGGTSEVMRNILAERVLGLPGEPRNDNKIPWCDIARNGAAVAVNR